MAYIIDKVKSNLHNGTLLRNGVKAVRNRFIKALKSFNLIYSFDENRIRTKKYLSSIPLINENHIKAGNYFIDKRLTLSNNSVVYSLGILTDVSFDLYIAKTYSSVIHMYDPTPIAIEFMSKYEDYKNFQFHPYGVWIEEDVLKFYEPKLGGSSSLISNSDSSDKYFEAKCFTMAQLMKQNNHSYIDLFKADIEGAALPILEQMLQQGIYPNQIIVEFERPKKGNDEIDSFFDRITALREKLKANNYQEYQLPRKKAKYFSLELLFVKV